MNGAEASADELRDRLVAVVRDAWADDQLVVEDLVRLAGGASRETWSFDAVDGRGRREGLVLRRDIPGVPRPGGGAITYEAIALRAAGAADVPVPRLFAYSDGTNALDAPYMIMERVDGEALPSRILGDPDLLEARAGLARACGRVLARLHSIERSSVMELPVSTDPLAEWSELLEQTGEARPMLDLTVRWLETNRPDARPAGAVVHGDFRNGNLIVGREGIRSVLDWEVVHWGDPGEDLGWLCVKAWRFKATPPVGGFGSYEDLLAGYIEAGGSPMEVATLRWWEVLGTLRWAVSCLRMCRQHLDGLVRSVELAAIGRRCCESEWDLLLALRELSQAA